METEITMLVKLYLQKRLAEVDKYMNSLMIKIVNRHRIFTMGKCPKTPKTWWLNSKIKKVRQLFYYFSTKCPKYFRTHPIKFFSIF